MYCETCKTVFDEASCPECGTKNVREPMPNDDCLLTEKEMLWGEMLSDVLKQNGIPFYFKSQLGAGLAMSVGLYRDRYRFYVPYSRLTDAQRIVDELFANKVDGGE